VSTAANDIGTSDSIDGRRLERSFVGHVWALERALLRGWMDADGLRDVTGVDVAGVAGPSWP
jgi:hypothetical protein